jgi:predicted enzyme related to lactoylglutathione lyase
MPNPVVHWEICGADAARTMAFYTKLFDWPMDVHEAMNYGMVKAQGEGAIGGGLGATQGGAPPYVTIYVQVDDLQKYLDKAESLGGKTIVPPTPIPGIGSFAWFADPDGVNIGIYKDGE